MSEQGIMSKHLKVSDEIIGHWWLNSVSNLSLLPKIRSQAEHFNHLIT